jgi:hypothetical protein
MCGVEDNYFRTRLSVLGFLMSRHDISDLSNKIQKYH